MNSHCKAAILVCVFVAATTLASASTLSYTCDPNIDATSAGLCNSLNTTIASDYSTIFKNVDASIYIQFGVTGGVADSTSGFLNLVSYNTYLTALSTHSSGDTVDTDSLANLSSTEPALYNGGQIELTSALEQALGITGGTGTTATGAACSNPGTSGCYNGIITLDNPVDLASDGHAYYFGTGTQAANQFDIFSAVENQTDHILGASSCISTTVAPLADGCGGSNASAADLFRYQSPGNSVFLSTTPGAYFSYNGGVTTVGAPFNTLDNGEDYAGFVTNCSFVQDATPCLGSALDISTDGGAEATILDAVGYNLNGATTVNPSPPATPEPGTLTLLGTGITAIAVLVRRRHALVP